MDSSEDRTDDIQDNVDSPSSDGINESSVASTGGNIGKTAFIVIIVTIAGTLAAHALLTDGKCGSAGRCGASLALLNAGEQQEGAACCPSKETSGAACCPSTTEKTCDKADSGEVKTCPFEKAQDSTQCTQPKPCCPKQDASSGAVVDCPLEKAGDDAKCSEPKPCCPKQSTSPGAVVDCPLTNAEAQ